MRIKLPALVDQIIIIGTIITDKVSILVSWIIHATSTVQVTRIHLIKECHGVLLSIIPPFFQSGNRRIILSFILTSQINPISGVKVIVGRISLLVGVDARSVRVGTHHDLSAFEGHGSKVNFVVVVVVVGALAVVIGHVGEACEGYYVFVVINGPQMLGNLFIPLIMLLRITPKQQPSRIGLMTIQTPRRIIPKILIILPSRIIRIHIGTPCRPPFTIGTIPIIM
mmetsp:Transcript_3782/g.5481  ORF Transcript_3782/g.5481 Transcript_3782/m.5481 type:complete len:225 (+) Transcript_3782:759-1433(+)